MPRRRAARIAAVIIGVVLAALGLWTTWAGALISADFADVARSLRSPAPMSRVFDTIAARAGMPHLTVHGLRHEHASLLLQAGVPLLVASKRLGHSGIAITADLYSHLLPQADRDAARSWRAS